jgi:hypothetical protein
MKKIVVLSSMLVLVACKTKPVIEAVTFPEVGTISTAGVGDKLLTQGVGASVGAIVIAADQVIEETVVRKGKYVQAGENKEYLAYRGPKLQNNKSGAERNGFIYLFKKDSGTKKLCVSRALCADAEFVVDKHTHFTKAVSQQTLIYSGKVGDKITLGYREFFNEVARPAFSNDVVYDLSASSILGYKGARLQVINATNTEISYKVLADFD